MTAPATDIAACAAEKAECAGAETVDLAGLGRFASDLAAGLAAGDVVALHGDLGAGKTTLARMIIQARAQAAGEPAPEVPSPTFTLVQTYELPNGDIWHFDLYRIADAEEAWELGIEDAFATAISLIEWPERLGRLLPDRRLDVRLADGPDAGTRRLTVRDARKDAGHGRDNG